MKLFIALILAPGYVMFVIFSTIYSVIRKKSIASEAFSKMYGPITEEETKRIYRETLFRRVKKFSHIVYGGAAVFWVALYIIILKYFFN